MAIMCILLTVPGALGKAAWQLFLRVAAGGQQAQCMLLAWLAIIWLVQAQSELYVWRGSVKEWAVGRRLQPPQVPLPAALTQMMRNLFNLVDLDGGGTLNADEVAQVMTACNLPADRGSVEELFVMMDTNGDASVTVQEFEWWMREQISRGQPIDEGTFELPSGQVLLPKPPLERVTQG